MLSSSDPGGPRQPLRPVEAGAPRSALETYAARTGDAGADLPAPGRLRQVVPAQLQLRRGHLLPQHRPRPADPDLGPGRARSNSSTSTTSSRTFVSLAGADVAGRWMTRTSEPVVQDQLWASWLRRFAASGPAARRSRSPTRRIRFDAPALRHVHLVSSRRTDFAYARSGQVGRPRHAGRVAEVRRTRPDLRLADAARASRGATTTTTSRSRSSASLEGDAVIRFRHMSTGRASPSTASPGRDFRVVDIPPGWTHCIENVGPRAR